MAAAGRKQRRTVDYFPHMVKHKKTMYVLEQKYGNDGYSFWFKLLELLGDTDDHAYYCEDPAAWEFLVARSRLDESLCTEILDLLSRVGAIDTELWDKQQIIWCGKFVDNLADVYKKRRADLPSKPNIRCGNGGSNDISAAEIPQTKLNKIRSNETKEDHTTDPSDLSLTRNKSTAQWDTDSVEYQLALHLRTLIESRLPTARLPLKIPSGMRSWCRHVDRMLRIDKRPPEEVLRVMEWSQKDEFWQANILSTQKLREKFDTLLAQAEREEIRLSKPVMAENTRRALELVRKYEQEEE